MPVFIGKIAQNLIPLQLPRKNCKDPPRLFAYIPFSWRFFLSQAPGWQSSGRCHGGIEGRRVFCEGQFPVAERLVFKLWVPSAKLTWQWKMDHLKMYSLLKMGMFHCHVSLPECSNAKNWCVVQKSQAWLVVFLSSSLSGCESL